MPNQECAERDRLLERYQSCLAEYSRSVRVLETYTGIMMKDEYVKIKESAEIARIAWEDSRTKLASHFSQHGCEAAT